MDPSGLMRTPVTIASTSATASTDILGRPVRSAATTRTTTCRIVRENTMTPAPNVEGLLVSTTTIFLPHGTGLKDSDTVTIGTKTYQVLGAPEVLVAPSAGGFEKATIRLVEDAT